MKHKHFFLLNPFNRKMVQCLLEVLEGGMGLMLNQVDMYEEDGGGSRKGFGIYASRDIKAGEIFKMLYGALVPIPAGKQVISLKFYPLFRIPILFLDLNFVIFVTFTIDKQEEIF